MHLHIISRRTAKRAGLKRYFTGVACQNGSIAERYVVSCICTCEICIIAQRAKTAKWRKENKSHIHTYNKSLYWADAEAARLRVREYRAANPNVGIAYRKRDYKLNGDKNRQRFQQWRNKNPDKEVSRKKRYRANNREKIASYEQRYRKENRTAIRQRARDYSRRNQAKVLARVSERYARKKNAVPAWYGEFDALVFREAHDLRLIRNTETGITWHVDHMFPMQGDTVCGLHIANNIQVIPAVMNLEKRNRLVLTEKGEWLRS